MDSHHSLQLILLLGFAFAANLPLGYMREGVDKFSVKWFLYIHLSIPFIIAMRIGFDFGWSVVPFTLSLAILGQIAGSRFRRNASR